MLRAKHTLFCLQALMQQFQGLVLPAHSALHLRDLVHLR